MRNRVNPFIKHVQTRLCKDVFAELEAFAKQKQLPMCAATRLIIKRGLRQEVGNESI